MFGWKKKRDNTVAIQKDSTQDELNVRSFNLWANAMDAEGDSGEIGMLCIKEAESDQPSTVFSGAFVLFSIVTLPAFLELCAEHDISSQAVADKVSAKFTEIATRALGSDDS